LFFAFFFLCKARQCCRQQENQGKNFLHDALLLITSDTAIAVFTGKKSAVIDRCHIIRRRIRMTLGLNFLPRRTCQVPQQKLFLLRQWSRRGENFLLHLSQMDLPTRMFNAATNSGAWSEISLWRGNCALLSRSLNLFFRGMRPSSIKRKGDQSSGHDHRCGTHSPPPPQAHPPYLFGTACLSNGRQDSRLQSRARFCVRILREQRIQQIVELFFFVLISHVSVPPAGRQAWFSEADGRGTGEFVQILRGSS